MRKLTAVGTHGLAAGLLLAIILWLVAGRLAADDVPPALEEPAVDEGTSDSPPAAPLAVAQYLSGSIGRRIPTDIGRVPVGDMGTTPAKPVVPFHGVFFENDFSFLNDPNHDYVLGEEFKELNVRALTIGHLRLPDLECDDPDNVEIREFLPLSWLPEPTRFSAGGELRFRQMDEANRLRPGPPGRGDYQLWRWRQYVDLKVSDWFRVYAEMIDASVDNDPLAIQGIDLNRWDVQNLFLDLRLWTFDDDDDRPVWFRYGRQELLYGSQRLVGPLDWANTRRNFQGLKFFTRGSDWDFDLWFTRPVNTATTGDGPVSLFGSHFDSPNMNHTFSGAWFTYKAIKEHLFDLYWLWDFNSKLVQPGFQGGDRHTFATRWLGNFPALYGESKRTWHGEVEGGYQVGSNYQQNVSAGFIVAGLGHTWNDLPWQPDLWVYYDWASGSNNLNGRTDNTFAQQYGTVHAFLGQIDNVARQNISDINTKCTVKPLKQFTFQTQHHWFDLANSGDVLYTITGAPLGKPHTGTHVGNELDLVGTYVFNPNFNVQIGYFWFWYGAFVENNAPRGTAEQLYIQTTMSY